MTLNIPRPRPASSWKRPAARTLSWWRTENHALFSFHIRAQHPGGGVSTRLSRKPFAADVVVYFSGHGMATEAAPTEGEWFFRQWPHLAIARAGNHPARESNSSRLRACLLLRRFPRDH